MTLKWGSTTVTAVKWGSTTCTAVYWGSTLVFPDFDKTSFSVGYSTLLTYNTNTSKYIADGCKSTQGTSSYQNTSYAAASGYTLKAAGTKGSGNYSKYYYYCGTGLRTSGTISLSGKTSIVFNVTGSGSNSTSTATFSCLYGTAAPAWTNGSNSTAIVPTNYTSLGSVSKSWSSSTTENITFTFSGITATAYIFIRLGPMYTLYSKTCVINSATLN